ncbi:MAG TPA: DUF559 domain-containing protein [Polyangiaceae bacterium]|nr:DUF559 domain-containing protein [Polyangiaceae bacterium]
MRRSPTASERILWEYLRHGRLGVPFRRQVVLGRFIVDFFAPSVRLAVEVDGAVHASRAQYDALRDRGLAELGMRLLRVQAWRVERDVAAVVEAVRRRIEAGERRALPGAITVPSACGRRCRHDEERDDQKRRVFRYSAIRERPKASGMGAEGEQMMRVQCVRPCCCGSAPIFLRSVPTVGQAAYGWISHVEAAEDSVRRESEAMQSAGLCGMPSPLRLREGDSDNM